MIDADLHPEAAALERAAEWRLRQADAAPDEPGHLAAAAHLQALAEQLSAMAENKELETYRCLCHWLSASDLITDLAQAAHQYNARIGFGVWPETAVEYVRELNRMATALTNG